MNDRYKYLLKNINFILLGNLSTKIISFFLVPLYTNVLSTADYGSYDLVGTTINLLLPVLTISIADAVIFFVLDKSENAKEVYSVGIKWTCIGMILAVLITVINAIFGFFDVIIQYWYFFLIMFLMTGLVNLINNLARGLERMAVFSIGCFLSNLAVILLNILFLIVLKWGIESLFLAVILAQLVQFLYVAISVNMFSYITLKISSSLDMRMREYSIPQIFNYLAWWINSTLDRYIITGMCGVVENGIYSMASKIPHVLAIFQSSFGQSWALSVAKEYDENDTKGFFDRIYNMYSYGMIILCSLLILFNRFISGILYNKDFYVAWRYVPFLLIATVFSAVSGFYGSIYSVVKESKLITKTTIIGAIVNIVANCIFVYLFGAIGAAFSTSLAYAVTMLLREMWVKKYIVFKRRFRRSIIAYMLLYFQAFFMILVKQEGVFLYIPELTAVVIINIMYHEELFKILKIAKKVIVKILQHIKEIFG